MRLKFLADDTHAQADDEVADCGFTGERKAFGAMSEDGSLVRISWRDGEDGEDEGIVGFAKVRLSPGKVSIDFDRTADGFASTIAYEGVDIEYDDSDDRSSDLVEVFTQLLARQSNRIHVVTK